MALAGITLRVIKGSKLTITELDNNFSVITSSAETATANVVTINNRVSASVGAFPNLTTWTQASGIQTSGSLIISGGGAPFASGNLQVFGNTSLSGSLILSGSTTTTVLASNYVNDAAAQAGGIPIGGMYHNAGAIRIRIV
jgi:hypothetical protein